MRRLQHRSLLPAIALLLLSTSGLVACDAGNYSPKGVSVSAPTGEGVLPLVPGVYVVKGSDCRSPANAAIRIYTGRGISGSATRDCRATITSRKGSSFAVDQSCIDTYSSKRSTAAQSISIEDARHFSLREGNEKFALAFQLCPKGEAQDDLQRLVK